MGVILAWAALFAGSSLAAEPLRPFGAASAEALRSESAGRPFVLAFWSISCEPCRDDMRIFKDAQRRYPGVKIHLVAADPPGSERAIQAFLKRYDPGPVVRWAFADEYSERVRYSVDPAWRGELPRTYLYDRNHMRTALSGTLNAKSFEAWLSAQRSSAVRSESEGGAR